MDIRRRFLTQTLRENMDELHRSEMLKRQILMIARDIHLACAELSQEVRRSD
jgi:predicted translin family RNA/ssDNA-binding protein